VPARRTTSKTTLLTTSNVATPRRHARDRRRRFAALKQGKTIRCVITFD
jgi:hypothetical protein